MLDLHPDDAAARGIGDGDMVRVRNTRGVVVARARIGDVVGPGVVTLPSGWWASRSRGTSANALTGDELTDRGGGAVVHAARVEVERVTDVAPMGREAASEPLEV